MAPKLTLSQESRVKRVQDGKPRVFAKDGSDFIGAVQ
jgi:hypothetical protein